MTFDEQLRRAFETVADRLRDDIARHLQTVASDLTTAAETDRTQAAADARRDTEREANARIELAVATASADARAAAEREADARIIDAVAAAEASALESGRNEVRQVGAEAYQAGLLEGRSLAEQELGEKIDAAVAAARTEWRSAERAASERLVLAVRSIERAGSLTEILDQLVRSAGRETLRAAVFLLAPDARYRGWRFTGFGSSFDEANAIEFGVGEAGVVHEAARTGAAVRDTQAGAPAVAALPPGGECVAVPITLGGQVVAVVYGDDGSNPGRRDAPTAWPQTLEVLARHAAGCLERQTALKAAGLWPDRPIPPTLPVAPEMGA